MKNIVIFNQDYLPIMVKLGTCIPTMAKIRYMCIPIIVKLGTCIPTIVKLGTD